MEYTGRGLGPTIYKPARDSKWEKRKRKIKKKKKPVQSCGSLVRHIAKI